MTESQKHEELLDRLRDWAHKKRAQGVIGHCKNKDQTKQLLIVPYIRDILGRDPENPRSVRLEYQTGIGNGVEKVDYAILEDGKAVLLIEAKPARTPLDDQPTPQLRRYAIDSRETLCVALTNGSAWNWYKKSGDRLDDKPFLKNDALAPNEHDLRWLSALRVGRFNRQTMKVAEEEAMVGAVSAWLMKTEQKPNDSLLRLILRETGSTTYRSNIAKARRIWARAWQLGIGARNSSGDWNMEIELPQEEHEGEDAPPRSLACRYRIGGSTKWRGLQNAAYLLAEIVAYCANQHGKGREAYLRLLSRERLGRLQRPLLIFSNEPSRLQSLGRRYYSKKFENYHLFQHRSNQGKIPIIDRYLACCVRQDGTSPQRGVDIEIEMPNAT